LTSERQMFASFRTV